MALAAQALGHEYLAITDHSASHGFGNEVSPTALERQIEMVAEIDARLDGIRVLAGSEVNVLPDGSLDYEEELLARLDWIVASVHTSFRMSADAMTERMIRAIEHPLVDAIGHPTGRLIGKRQGYGVDVSALIDAAARTGNVPGDQRRAGPPRPRRLPRPSRRGGRGKLVLDSDAHRTTTLAEPALGGRAPRGAPG